MVDFLNALYDLNPSTQLVIDEEKIYKAEQELREKIKSTKSEDDLRKELKSLALLEQLRIVYRKCQKMQ